jgi:peptidoglycan hydrolase-like protein with peptidoglycan-binding domain
MDLLKTGARGQEVINLQEALNYHLPLALPPLEVDGKFGNLTLGRVKQFQKLRGLKDDGIVGPLTHGALYFFIENFIHMIVPPARGDAVRGRTSGLQFGDSPTPFGPVLPPFPRLELPFPTPFRPPPPPIFPLPKLTLQGESTQFELSAGVERTIARSLTNNTQDNNVSIFSDVNFSLWRRPIGKHLEMSFGLGAFFERELRPDPNTTLRIGVFAKAELKDVVKIGPLDLFKLIVEHKTVTTATGPIELNSDIEVGINPTVEVNVLGTKVEFGPKFSKFFEVGIGKGGFNLKSGSAITAGTVTVFF